MKQKKNEDPKTEFLSGFSAPPSSVDMQDVKNLVANKIEKTEFDAQMSMKSNKIDMETNMKAVDILHKQLQHLIVVFLEELRIAVNNTNETWKTQTNKRTILLQQTLSIARWAKKFNPENINSYDLSLPPDLCAF